jgi:hypothetical protein
MILYRPVGLKEYLLIKESGFREFPPRLADQPVFYPVTNQEYAEEIASGWNTKDEVSGYVGIVLRFEVDDRYIRKYEKKVVGNSRHEEYWIPAEELDEFNEHITGKVEAVRVFYGEDFDEGQLDNLREIRDI